MHNELSGIFMPYHCLKTHRGRVRVKIINFSTSLQMTEAGSSLRGYKFADTNGLRAQTINITGTQGKSVKGRNSKASNELKR